MKGFLGETYQWMNNDCKQILQRINVPIISINSDEQPTNLEAFRRYVPSFKVKVVSDAGHFLVWEKPEIFNELLEQAIKEFQNN